MNFHARHHILLAAFLGTPALSSQAQIQSSANLKVPVMVPDASVLQLDDLGLYQLSYLRRGGAEQFYPTGWVGGFDEATGVACQPHDDQNGRRAWLLHPPWRGGPTGYSRQSFTFALPKVRHIELRGAFAMQSDNTVGSDGVTFRVKVGSDTLLDENTKATQWRDFSFDLTRYAGKPLTIAFESDAGPDNNSSFDFALWGGRQLVLDGFTPPLTPHPAPISLPLLRVARPKVTMAPAPQGGYEGQQKGTVSSGQATLGYRGADGTFDYLWQPPQKLGDSPLGTVSLTARMKTASGQLASAVHVPLANDASVEWVEGAGMKLQSSQFQKSANGVTLVSRYVGDKGQTATLRLNGHLAGKSLICDVTCDQPLIKSFSAGQWGPAMRRKALALPYYMSDGQVYLFPKQNLFVNAFNDWTASNASFLDNRRAVYNALTNGQYNLLRERAIFAPAWHVDEVLPNIPNPPSPFLREVGGKVVLDIWGGKYTDIAEKLKQYHNYGLSNLIAIIHDWQREGYDNALPAHYPARASLGGDEGMKTLVHTATSLGYRIALHENYVDYYPNYEHFDPNDISLRSDRTRETAWYNEGTKTQSFAEKPTAILRIAGTQSPEIHRRYSTNANYLDVHSAVPPWFHVDQRAGEAGAGKFSTVFQTHKNLWAFERATHGGPSFGEGSNHWFWSGLLDGAEAQVTDGWNTPMLVDFDLLKMHELESNHGMGYYERWWNQTNWNGLPPMRVLDRYRMQTLAFGHAGFLGAPTWGDLRLAWQEHNLVTPVTARYATARPTEISYFVNGRWMDSSSALQAGAKLDRVRVSYDNGLTLVANNSSEPFRVGSDVLPQYGWRAIGAGLTASTKVRDGVVTDFAETPTSTYVNARNATTWNLNSEARTRASVSDFAQTGPRQFRLHYKWIVGESYTSDYRVFVHFTQPTPQDASAVAFQDDHALTSPTTGWQVGNTVDDGPHDIHIPDGIKDGDYKIALGLFNEEGRHPIGGDLDANGRAVVGAVRISNGGQEITFMPPVDQSAERRRLYEANINTSGKVVDFGSVRTNGSVMVRREGTDWVMQTFPREQKFVVELSNAHFGHPQSVQTAGTSTATIHSEAASGSRFWQLELNGAKEYRWKAEAQ